MSNIERIYKMLNWKNTPAVLAEGKRLASAVENISLLIMPPAAPSVWGECAEVLCEKSDQELEPHLSALLAWLEDLNWLGALTILDRLKRFSGEKLKAPFLDRVAQATAMHNEEGLRWLDYLSELLDNESLKAELPTEVAEMLTRHYQNWAFWYEE